MPRRLKGRKQYSKFILLQILIIIALVLVLKLNSNSTQTMDTDQQIVVSDEETAPKQVVQSSEAPKLPSPLPDAAPANAELDFLLGKIDYRSHPDFFYVNDSRYTNQELPVHKEVFDAFKRMQTAAQADGVTLRIVSAARNWSRQKSIWESRLNSLGYRASMSATQKQEILRSALRYNSLPGISRHHWGTELDLNSVDPAYFNLPQGRKILAWLEEHAGNYGFIKTYTDDPSRSGFSYEPWHWSYAPISRTLYSEYISKINYSSLTGFTGSDQIESMGIIRSHVMGINPALK